MNAPATIIRSEPLRQVRSVKDMLANKNAFDQLDAVAASHLNPEAMMRTLALSVSKTPKLAECTPMSLLGALMTSASLGLVPNSPMGLAYLVPYGTDAQLIIGYRGYVQLGHNSDQIAWLDAGIHYSDDPLWRWRRGSSAVLDHEQGDMAGEMLHAYAIFEKANGGKTWVVWPEAKLVAHRDRYSQGYKADIKRGKKPTDANVNVWLAHPDIARMKTMIRQLAKVMPMSSEIPRAAAVDGARADFAGFAMDPSMGMPEIEANTDEGEASEADVVERDAAPSQIENKPAAHPVTTAAPAKEKAPAAGAVQNAGVSGSDKVASFLREPALEGAHERIEVQRVAPSSALADMQAKAKATVRAKKAPEPEEPEESVVEDDKPEFTGLAERILEDVMATPPADAFSALEIWQDQLDGWQAQDREGHAAFLDKIAEREAEG